MRKIYEHKNKNEYHGKSTEEDKYWDRLAKDDVKHMCKEWGWIGLAKFNLWQRDEGGGSEPTMWLVFKEIVGMITRPMLYPFQLRYCWVFGHKMDIDLSYAGPDSGGDGAGCSRCGYSWLVTYY